MSQESEAKFADIGGCVVAKFLPRKYGHVLILMMPSIQEEHYMVPAESFTLAGIAAIKTLRDFLNYVYPIE